MDPGNGNRSVSVRSDGTRESNQKPSWVNAAQEGFCLREGELMDTRVAAILGAVISILVTPSGSQVALAADCGEPAPTPKYQVGERWTWQDEKGRGWSSEVVQVEGDLTQIKWGTGDVASYDKDWVIQKVIRANGEALTKQNAGAYRTYEQGAATSIGEKVLDFPLQVGKKWQNNYVGQPTTGAQRHYNQWFKVVACEELLTPSGKFPALKVEVEMTTTGATGSGTYYIWYAPKVKNYVQRKYVWSKWWSGGDFRDVELVKFEGK